MPFIRRPVKFTLADIGSKVIDQFSSDIYSGPGSIIRELVKNAYDSYLPIPSDELDDEDIRREIVISRERERNGTGRLLIADSGIGQTLDELKGNVQISISKKPTELENATGFRGLGSWASLGAGTQIVITSTKKGTAKQGRLTIFIRTIYAKMSPDTTLDDILNDPKCILFEEQDFDPAKHGTVVEVICDGPTTIVHGYELNRLYEFTDRDDKQLRNILIQSCPIPFSSEGGGYEKIQKLYEEVGYIPTNLSLDGEQLYKRLPAELTDVAIEEIRIGDKVAAKVWVATNPKETGEISQIDDAKHLLGGPGIQLAKFNVPIGLKNIFSDGTVRAGILRWAVGEVHIALPDVLPNASGQELRAGTARDLFIIELQSFYQRLEKQFEAKSNRLSMERKLRKGIEAAKKVAAGKLSSAEKAYAESAIAKAVEVIDETSSTGKAATVTEKRLREAAKDPDVKKVRAEARKLFKQQGLLVRFSTAATRTVKKRATKAASISKVAPTNMLISLDEFQARLGRAIPRLSALGLSGDQIDKLLKIINEVVIGEV